MTDPTSTPTMVNPDLEPQTPSRWAVAWREIVSGSPLRTVLAIVLAFVVGAVLIIVTNPEFLASVGYIFSRPSDAITAAVDAVVNGYGALFRGAILNLEGDTFAEVVRPLTETLRLATPLIAAGLGIALSFRVGMFNIGGQGQLLFGAGFAGFVSFHADLPFPLHLLLAIVAGILGAAAYGALVGLLKAKTGANEVIVTIMLNYIAFYLLTYLMRTPVLQDPDASLSPDAHRDVSTGCRSVG